MTAFGLRRYEPADADAVQTLHERVRRGGACPHHDADLRAVRPRYLDAGGEFLVGERADRVVATGAFRPHNDAVVLRRLRIAPAHRRSGYGTRVLNDLEARARKRGFERAELDTTPDRTAAVAFYEHHGYERVGREYVDAVGATLLFYEKPL